MQVVADRLAEIAGQVGKPDDVDAFGRSAFNRYYYAAFLAVRETLKAINPAWSRPTHKDIPDILEGSVREAIKRQIRNWEKSGALPPSRASSLRTSANASTGELAMLLKSAREVRRIADYEPETRCKITAALITLGNDSLQSAHQWPARARSYISTILKIYRELGLI
jgi:hypothetical protein